MTAVRVLDARALGDRWLRLNGYSGLSCIPPLVWQFLLWHIPSEA